MTIPSKVFKSAGRLAEKVGVSRNRLFVTAIKSYIEAHDGEAVTAKLNKIYSRIDSKLDPKLKELQALAISREPW